MESLERKDVTTAGPEEPIKSEEIVASPDNGERSNNASPPPNCSICLGKLVNTSFTDSCLHQFCFTCLLQWSKIKTECPLCKQTFKSIIHNVRSEEDYDQYHVQNAGRYSWTSLTDVTATLDVTADIHISGHWDTAVGVASPVRPFVYRTTMGANRRFLNGGVLLNPDAVARREQIPSHAPEVTSEERRRRNTNPLNFRRNVYMYGIWASDLPDAFGRFRESSAEYYRRHPSEVNRLIPWLNRELQVLLSNHRSHISYVMSVITDSITLYDIQSSEFRSIIRPYFGINTAHFIHEFHNFARTNFDIVGYDQAVTYPSNRGLSNEYVPRAASPTPSTSSSSSSDSDVRVLEDNFEPSRLNSYNMPSVGPHIMDMPGPSTVVQTFRIQLPYTVPDVLTISSTSDSENECEVVGYVKPRHERTPEIIDLSSSDTEAVIPTTQSTSNDYTRSESCKDETQSSTSYCDNSNNRRTRRRNEESLNSRLYDVYMYSSLESDEEESDSDYNPASKSRRYKSSSKKSSRVISMLRKSRSNRKSKDTSSHKRGKESQNRSSSSYTSDREASSSRGQKRYLSKSSNESDCEKNSSKKSSKKSKKTKSSKKSKKRSTATSSKAVASYKKSCNSSDNSSTCSEYNGHSDSEENSKRRSSRKRSQKSSKNSSHRSSSDKSSSKFRSDSSGAVPSTSTRRTSESVNSVDKHYWWWSSSERSQNAPRNPESLDDFVLRNVQNCFDREESRASDQSNISNYSNNSILNSKMNSSKASSAATTTKTASTSSRSSEHSRSPSAALTSSSKSDASSSNERLLSSKRSSSSYASGNESPVQRKSSRGKKRHLPKHSNDSESSRKVNKRKRTTSKKSVKRATDSKASYKKSTSPRSSYSSSSCESNNSDSEEASTKKSNCRKRKRKSTKGSSYRYLSEERLTDEKSSSKSSSGSGSASPSDNCVSRKISESSEEPEDRKSSNYLSDREENKSLSDCNSNSSIGISSDNALLHPKSNTGSEETTSPTTATSSCASPVFSKSDASSSVEHSVSSSKAVKKRRRLQME